MPVYAPVPNYGDRARHPRALLLIVGAHAALLAAVMTVKMDLPLPFTPTPTTVSLIPEPKAPPKDPPPPQPKQDPARSVVERVPNVVPVPQPRLPPMDATPTPVPLPLPDVPLTIGSGTQPRVDPVPVPAPVRTGPRFATPDSLLKPPYPQQKLRSEEEAVLRLKLSIDQRGRVTAVDPVGSADAAFLASARRHLIAHWRYQPATEDGRPVASSMVITLRFQLGD